MSTETSPRFVRSATTQQDVACFPYDKARGWFPLPNLKDQIEYLSAAGYAYSYFLDGELVGMAGIHCAYSGVGEAWAISTDKVNGARVSFHKAVARTIKDIVAAVPMHRVHCYVDATYPQGLRWAVSLGFRPEARLRKVGPQQQDMHVLSFFPGE